MTAEGRNQESTEGREEQEITKELEKAPELEKPAKEPKPAVSVMLSLGMKTDLGRVRENNEDKFDFFEPDEGELLAQKGRLYVVADGMGGHAAGQIASELAIKTLIDSYFNDGKADIQESLRDAFRKANSLVYEASQGIVSREGMGTTLTAAVIIEDDLFIAQVGDSRLYHFQKDQSWHTKDHSVVQEQVELGSLTEEEAKRSPFKNIITRSIGNKPEIEVDIYQRKIEKGDVIVLCSDGLSDYVSDEELRQICQSHGPSVAAAKLVDLANERGGRDNITVMVIKVLEMKRESLFRPFQILKKLFGARKTYSP